MTAFTERGLAVLAAPGIEAKRLLTDDHGSYARNRSLRELLAAQGIKHMVTAKRRPQTNGKVERFHQTMASEWAGGIR